MIMKNGDFSLCKSHTRVSTRIQTYILLKVVLNLISPCCLGKDEMKDLFKFLTSDR